MDSCSRSSRRRKGSRFQLGDFGQESGGFVLQRRLERLVIGVGYFAGIEFKIQVAEIFVDGVFAFAEILGASLVLAEIEFVGQVKNVKHRSGEDQNAAGPFKGHRSVSWPPCSRDFSRSAALAGGAPPDGGGGGRFFHARITNTTPITPAPKEIGRA